MLEAFQVVLSTPIAKAFWQSHTRGHMEHQPFLPGSDLNFYLVETQVTEGTVLLFNPSQKMSL
jgi:hypothetical protein